MKKIYTIVEVTAYSGRKYSHSGTIEELVQYYSNTLKNGHSRQYDRASNRAVNVSPSRIDSLINNLNKASHNCAVNGNGSYYYVEK